MKFYAPSAQLSPVLRGSRSPSTGRHTKGRGKVATFVSWKCATIMGIGSGETPGYPCDLLGFLRCSPQLSSSPTHLRSADLCLRRRSLSNKAFSDIYIVSHPYRMKCSCSLLFLIKPFLVRAPTQRLETVPLHSSSLGFWNLKFFFAN